MDLSPDTATVRCLRSHPNAASGSALPPVRAVPVPTAHKRAFSVLPAAGRLVLKMSWSCLELTSLQHRGPGYAAGGQQNAHGKEVEHGERSEACGHPEEAGGLRDEQWHRAGAKEAQHGHEAHRGCARVGW